MKKNIRFTGFGGQGIITAGYFFGSAASVHEHYHATMVQSYGPEARGSACASQVIISDEPILSPYIEDQDVLVAMSQEGFDQYFARTTKKGLVLIDAELVKPPEGKQNVNVYAIPATRLAEQKLNRRIMANVIMLGFLVKTSGLVKIESLKSSISAWAPKGMEQLNAFALELGKQYTDES